MPCRHLLLWLVFLAFAGTRGFAAPNVLLILTDDQGFGDIGSHGNPVLQTPVLDRLAGEGARFDRFYVSPVCAPTRAALLTGRYHLRTGVSGVTRGYENLRAEEVTLAEVLHEAGYATGCFGKWHNGRHMPSHPNGQGFDEFIGFCGGHWNTYFDPPLEHNGETIQREGYIADLLTDAAIEFMTANRETPWFCYVPYNTPHSPWRVPDANYDKFADKNLDEKARCAYAMVDNLDHNIGRLLATLESQQCVDDTIVLFLTDNGANSPRYNAGMKGYKGSVDEGGTRVPLFIRYPGVIPAGTIVRPITAQIDLLPTLAELCGVEIAESHRQRLDGRSLVPLLTGAGEAHEWPARTLFVDGFRADAGRARLKGAARTDRWRAVMSRPGQWSLYDMSADPGQEHDVAAAHPETLAGLSRAFDDWFADVMAIEPTYPPIPVGHPARRRFELTANEAMLEGDRGGIAYTGEGGAGWANSWIHNWTSMSAFPRWEIEVLEAGEYAVAAQSTCRAADVGCEFELTFTPAGDTGNRLVEPRTLTLRVTDPIDPPLLPKPDRIYSDNYQDKAEWGLVPAGKVELPEGRYVVELRMRARPGSAGIDLKGLLLTRP
ncbi:MAG: arylsulfatase [Planctomycetaceae bacterium]